MSKQVPRAPPSTGFLAYFTQPAVVSVCGWFFSLAWTAAQRSNPRIGSINNVFIACLLDNPDFPSIPLLLNGSTRTATFDGRPFVRMTVPNFTVFAAPYFFRAGQSRTRLIFDEHDVDGFDGDSDCIPFLDAQLIEGVERHHRFDESAASDLHFDLAHDGAPLDFHDFPFQTIACANLHGCPPLERLPSPLKTCRIFDQLRP